MAGIECCPLVEGGSQVSLQDVSCAGGCQVALGQGLQGTEMCWFL